MQSKTTRSKEYNASLMQSENKTQGKCLIKGKLECIMQNEKDNKALALKVKLLIDNSCNTCKHKCI